MPGWRPGSARARDGSPRSSSSSPDSWATRVRVFASAIPLALVTGWSVPTSVIAMGIVTMIYTWFGGFKAVVWTDVLQLSVYLAGGVGALLVAWSIAGGPAAALGMAAEAGKLKLIAPELDFTQTYTLLGGLLGGALLSAASHGTDHLIVQRLLATRSLADARIALVGSGVMVILQFTLFLLVGLGDLGRGTRARPRFPATSCSPSSWSSTCRPDSPDWSWPASSPPPWARTAPPSTRWPPRRHTTSIRPGPGRRDPVHLLKVGRLFSAVWGTTLIFGALFFHYLAGGSDTPVVVLALSIASVTYGALLGTYLLAAKWPRATGRDVIAAVLVTVSLMLVVIFARRLAGHDGTRLARAAGTARMAVVRPAGDASRVRHRCGGELSSWNRGPTAVKTLIR